MQQYQAINQPYAVRRDNKKKYNFNCYEQGERLGNGAFGKVIKVYRSFVEYKNGPILKWPYACKIQNKSQLKKQVIPWEDEDGLPCFSNAYEILKEELDIYKYLDCKNICKLFEYIYDDEEKGDYSDETFQILQYCDLGDLLTWDQNNFKFLRNPKLEKFIQQKYNIGLGIGPGLGIYPSTTLQEQQEIGVQANIQNNLREKIAKVIFKQVLQGIIYLHENLIANRDIKPQNILCKSYDESRGHHIKLADFSLAKKLQSLDDMITSPGGTPGIQSPEQAIGDEYNPFQSDIWSFGITIYCFLALQLPWETDINKACDIQWQEQAQNLNIQWNKLQISQELKSLLQQCLQLEPTQRPTATQLIQHQWFNNAWN